MIKGTLLLEKNMVEATPVSIGKHFPTIGFKTENLWRFFVRRTDICQNIYVRCL